MKRNEPCDCGSGLKYKKCCGNEAVKAKGRNEKIAAKREAMLKRIEETRAAHVDDNNQSVNKFGRHGIPNALIAASIAMAPLMNEAYTDDNIN